MSEPRRQHPRYLATEVTVVAQFATSQELFRVPCRDIGIGGVFVHTRHRAPVGQEVALTLKLPTEEGPRTVELTAEVVRVDDDGSGMALAFTFSSDDDPSRGALEACLRGLARADGA